MHLVDGKAAAVIPADDRGLAYGDGLFETIALLDHQPLALAQHLERLECDARRLGIPPPARSALMADIDSVLADRSKGVLKVIVTRGSGGRGYRPEPDANCRRVVSTHPWPRALETTPPDNLHGFVCRHRLSTSAELAGIKHLNRLDQVMASREWPDERCFEGLMCDTDGNLIEGTRSNIFLLIKGQLVTPRLDRAGVCGIVRNAVIEHCHAQDQRVDEAVVTMADLTAAEEIFLTSSVAGVRSLGYLRGPEWHAPGPPRVAAALRAALTAAGIIV